jgi:hypothetical protein
MVKLNDFSSIPFTTGWLSMKEKVDKFQYKLSTADNLLTLNAFSIPGMSDPMWSARQSGKTTTGSFKTENAPTCKQMKHYYA